MTSAPAIEPQAGPPLTGADILHNARQLAGRIREKDLAAEYDRIRRLPADIVEEIRGSGIMRMNMPRIWGGPEMTSMEQVEVIEELAKADASVAWCSFIWCDSGLYSGYLDDAVGREMYPRLDMATSGWIYPVAPAHRVPGGYRADRLPAHGRADQGLGGGRRAAARQGSRARAALRPRATPAGASVDRPSRPPPEPPATRR